MFNPRDIDPTRQGAAQAFQPASRRSTFPPAASAPAQFDRFEHPERPHTPLCGHRYGPASDSSLHRLGGELLQSVPAGNGPRLARIGSVSRPFLDRDRTRRNNSLGALEQNPDATLPEDPRLQAQMLKTLAAHWLTPSHYLFGDENGWVRQDMTSAVKRDDARCVAERFPGLTATQRRTVQVMLAYVSSYGVQTLDLQGTPVRLAAYHLNSDASQIFPVAEDISSLSEPNRTIAQCYRISRFMSGVQRAFEWGWIAF
jgi:hypothetical protein